MKIADYGKAITSYIESPTTAQKLLTKSKVQPLDRTLLADGTEIIPQKKPKQLKDLFEKINRTVLAVRSNTISPELIVPNLEKETQEYIKDGVISGAEARKFAIERKKYWDNWIKENPGGTAPSFNFDNEGNAIELSQEQITERINESDGGRIGFDRGGVAQVKAYVESLPKNTVVTRKLIKDFIEANDLNVNFQNLFNKNKTSYVGNFIKDKSITIDASKTPDKFKKTRAILDDPKKLKEFLKYGNKDNVSIKDILKKYKISNEEFYAGGLRELFDKDFQTQAVSQIKNKTINNVNKLLNDSEAASFLKKGNVVPDDVLARLKILPGEAATATVRIGQIYGGNNFGIDDFKKIRKNIKVSDKLFDTMNKFTFGNPYRSKLYKTSLELIDQQLGNDKGTFESLKKKASYILKKNKIKGFDINEIAGVTGTAKTGAGEFSQFIDVLDSNVNQKQGAAFQSAFSTARQKIAANPAVFETEARKINKLASKFESEYGFKLPRIRKLEDVEKFYSPKRLKDLTEQGIDIKKASEKLGYTIEMPKGAVTAQEFVQKPGLKEKFLKGIGTGAKAFGKVIKPVGYAIGTAAAYQAKSMADEMDIELKPLDYFIALESGDPELAIKNYKMRTDPEFAMQEKAKTLAIPLDEGTYDVTDDQSTFGKYNDQIKNIKLP